MKISSSLNSCKPNFKAAQVNILATSDNHGNVHSLPKFVKTIETNKNDIFEKSNEQSTLNIFAIAGDWFINPSKKGFITKPKMTNGDIQFRFLKETIDAVHQAVGKRNKFETIFTMGNHDLDGGDKFLYHVVNSAPMKTLITNVDMDNSSGMSHIAGKKPSTIAKSFEFSIPDDKNPRMKHKVLFVGATIPTMDFYNPGLLKRMSFFDNGNFKDTSLTEDDIQGTIQAISDEVTKFKEENPKGAVILLSHMGNRLSKIVRDNVPQINVILNGHDHKYLTSLVGKTNINSLGKDNEMIKALNLRFDDNGDLSSIDMNVFFSDLTLADGLENHKMQAILDDNFKADVYPIVRLTNRTAGDARLDYGNEIRFSNSYLANYLTSAVKRSVREMYPDVFAVAIQSSIIRGGIKDDSNNLDLMKVFDGVSENLATLQIGEVTGYELAGLITENILSNLKAPTRNTIIHWSDVQVDRTLISQIQSGESDKKYIDAVKVRRKEDNEFEPINPKEKYKIVLPEKYLVKDDIKWPQKIRSKFEPIGKTYDQLFREYLDSIDYQIHITDKTKEKRIL